MDAGESRADAEKEEDSWRAQAGEARTTDAERSRSTGEAQRNTGGRDDDEHRMDTERDWMGWRRSGCRRRRRRRGRRWPVRAAAGDTSS